MKTKLTTIFKKSANTPPMWVCLLFALVISTNCWADVPAVTSLTSSVSEDDITLTWTNYNKLDLTSDNVKEE